MAEYDHLENGILKGQEDETEAVESTAANGSTNLQGVKNNFYRRGNGPSWYSIIAEPRKERKKLSGSEKLKPEQASAEWLMRARLSTHSKIASHGSAKNEIFKDMASFDLGDTIQGIQQSPKKWAALETFCQKMMRKKEDEERARQGQPRKDKN